MLLSGRRYPSYTELAPLNGLQFDYTHFVRVSFGDEQGDKMFGHRGEPIDPFYDRMRQVTGEGKGAVGVMLPGGVSQACGCMGVVTPALGQPMTQ